MQITVCALSYCSCNDHRCKRKVEANTLLSNLIKTVLFCITKAPKELCFPLKLKAELVNNNF